MREIGPLWRGAPATVIAPKVVIVVLFVFWMVLAFRQLQRGDWLLAGLFTVVGVVLSACRWNALRRTAKPEPSKLA